MSVFEIIGVVEDYRFSLPETMLTRPDLAGVPRPTGPEPAVFMIAALIQREVGDGHLDGGLSNNTVSFAMRAGADPLAMTPDLRSVIRQVDPTVGLEDITTMSRVIDGLNTRPRFYAAVLSVFAGIAGFLAALGVYGVLAYAVAQRTREIGIRVALGARSLEVLMLILHQGVAMVGIGIAVGVAGAAAFTRSLAGMLYGLTPLDPVTYGVVIVIVAFAAILASWVPARRATKVDPLVALRYE